MNFTDEQIKAVQTDSSKALVLAGAGSGKTAVITERIFYLLEQNVSPHEILVITFTKKTADEMRRRIESRIGLHAASEMFIGTFHSWCLDYLFRFKDVKTVLSQPEENILIKQIAIDLGFYTNKKWRGIKKSDVEQIFFHFYNYGWQEDDLIGDGLLIFQEFIRQCRESRMITYGMVLTEFAKYISEFDFYYKHILIDEVQDMNETQWQIINTFQRNKVSVFCVGDIDQSIYEWRGANPEYLILNSDSFDIFYIRHNFRSCEKIVHAANSLIAHNDRRFDKTMFPTLQGGTIWAYLYDMDSEKLSDLLTENHPFPKPVAVLARTHFLLSKLSEVLSEKNCRHCYIGNGNMDTEEWLKIHAYLKLFVNSYDNFSFMILSDDLVGDKQGYAKLRERAKYNQQSHFQEWLQSEYRERCSLFDLACGSDMMFDDLLYYIRKIFNTEQTEVLIEEMLYIAHSFKTEPMTVEEYIRYLPLWELRDYIDYQNDDLYLMTVHASKGLEFPTVIIAGLNEGIFPVKKGNIEEERRLLYVGMTRAKEVLCLTARPEQTESDGRIYKNPVSRFMSEIKAS